MLIFGSMSVNCTNASMPYIFTSRNEFPGHQVVLIAKDDKRNSARIIKYVQIMDPPKDLALTASQFIGIYMQTYFQVAVTGKNMRLVAQV